MKGQHYIKSGGEPVDGVKSVGIEEVSRRNECWRGPRSERTFWSRVHGWQRQITLPYVAEKDIQTTTRWSETDLWSGWREMFDLDVSPRLRILTLVPLPCALFFLPGLLLLWGDTPGVVTNFKSAKINWLQMELVQLTLLVLKNFLRLNATKTRHRILNQCQRLDNYWERGSTCVRGIELTFPGKGNMYCGAEYSDASHFEDLFVLAI